jgi:hypothetical protein
MMRCKHIIPGRRRPTRPCGSFADERCDDCGKPVCDKHIKDELCSECRRKRRPVRVERDIHGRLYREV